MFGQRGILLRDKAELQLGEMVIDGAKLRWRRLRGVVLSHDGVPPLCRVILAVGGRDQCSEQGVRG
jgi:hypothetical protein